MDATGDALLRVTVMVRFRGSDESQTCNVQKLLDFLLEAKREKLCRDS